MSQDFYYKSEAAKKTGLESRLIQFYTEKLGIEPDIARPKKKGSNRKYSRENLIEFLLVSEFRKYNLNLVAIGKILKFVRKEGKGRKQSWWVDQIERKPTKKVADIAYALIYEPFRSEKMNIKFHIINKRAGHLFRHDNTPMTLQEYTREAQGGKMVLIINLSNILSDVMKKL